MTTDKKIDCSIIIPTFNAEKTIRNAINSVCLSKASNFLYEVIIVDDGSLDDTLKIVNEFKHERITVIKKTNGGVSSARNVGLVNANGEFIYFMDADDEVYRDVLDEMLEIGYRELVDIILADYTLMSFDSVNCCVNIKYNAVLDKEYCINSILPRLILNDKPGLNPIWNKIYSKKFIEKNKLLFDEERSHGEDWFFNIRCFENASTVFYLNKTLYKYVVRGNQSLDKYKLNVGYGFLESHMISLDIIKTNHLADVERLIVEKVTVNTANNIVRVLSIDSYSCAEKKAFLEKKETKNVFDSLSKLDNSILDELSLSRKDKLAYALLKRGLYRIALNILR